MVEKYRHIGLKLTPQRLAILDYLEGNTAHPTAEEIYRAVLKKFPTISFATVYTTLAALAEKGKLSEISSDPEKKHYDPDTSDHSHLFCVSCKGVFDIPVEYSFVLPKKIEEEFAISRSHVEFQGLCPKCKKKNPNNDSKASATSN